MRIVSFPVPVVFLIVSGLVANCSGSSTGQPTTNDSSLSGGGGSGGSTTTASGGASATGGTSANGGSVGTGGKSATGGSPTTGGTTTSGGTTASGGAKASGGAQSTCGALATGGSTSTGGVPATGGNTAPGGSTGSGGKISGSGGSSTGSGGKINGSGGNTSSGGASGSPGIDGGAPTGTATIPGNGCTPPAAYNNLFVSLSGHTQADSDAKIAAAWSKLFNPSGSGNIYFNGPGSDESYVKDTYNNDVRTEGMGYGLVIAVELDHQTEFDRLWTWVKTHMANGTGEISWQCSTSGSKMSSGGAPDGETYMATALIFAHNRWGDTSGKYKYATEAQWVLDLIRTKYFNSQYHIVKFVSGSNNTDASYILPAFYQVWACFDTTNKDFWDASVKAARDFFHSAIDGSGVIPDQSSWTGGTVKGATVDWIRCVANIMMDWNFFAADTWQADTYATKFGAHEKNAGANAQGFCDATLGFGLPASSGKAFVDRIYSAGIPTSYWDGTLYMLALLHVSGTFHLWY